MADNNTNRQNNPQPSMRELANERMRKMREERAAEIASRQSSETRRTQPSASQRTSSAGTQRTSGQARPSASRQIQPEGSQTRRPQSASSERTAATRQPSSRPSEARTTTTSGETRRPSSSSGATRRPTQGSSSSAQRRPSQSSSAKRPATSSATRRPTRPVPKKKQSPVFWVGLGLYIAILIVLAFIFLKYTDKCLKRYENSQPENYIASFVETFEKNAKDGSLTPSDFTFESLDLTFVDSEILLEDYIDSLGTYSSFTAEKDPTSYITEAPVYNISADGEPVARVTLKAISQTKIYAILTIMDWDVDTIEPVCSIDLTNYTFSIPDGYTPVINNRHVDASYKTGNVEEIHEFAYVSNYIDMPEYVEYKVENVLADSDIKVLNTNGEEVPIEINGSKVKATYASAASELSEERKNEALSMIQTYEDFNTDDLSGANHGLATVQSFLIKDSDYWNMAKQWAGGVDITFTSAHKFDDPKYTNVVVDNYAEYSDICYSLHIAFSKNMILTRTGEKISNDFDSTVFFIYYDDSDDGVDNPHWCIADMIATTK
ncbi:MAG: hypothetical protein IKS56_03820 [Lachnospiraceae bacterium]|nr:hypothetical protein [Lachnospiraceae bacterium]